MGNKKRDLHIVDLDLKPRKKSGQRLLATPTHSKAVYLQSQPAGPVKLDTLLSSLFLVGCRYPFVRICLKISPCLRYVSPVLRYVFFGFRILAGYDVMIQMDNCFFHGKSTETSDAEDDENLRNSHSLCHGQSKITSEKVCDLEAAEAAEAGGKCWLKQQNRRQKPGAFRHGDSNQKHVRDTHIPSGELT